MRHKKAVWLVVALVVALIYMSGRMPQATLSPLQDNAVVLALGDSLTYGTGVDQVYSYPSRLADMTGLSVINAGVPGETSAGTLVRVKAELDKHRPQLVILCIGGNDILRRKGKQEIVGNIQQIIDVIKSHDIQLVLLAVPEFGLFPTAPEFYSELAEENAIPLDKDTIPSVLRDSDLKSDPIHGNEAGYQVIADGVYRLLQEAGAIK